MARTSADERLDHLHVEAALPSAEALPPAPASQRLTGACAFRCMNCHHGAAAISSPRARHSGDVQRCSPDSVGHVHRRTCDGPTQQPPLTKCTHPTDPAAPATPAPRERKNGREPWASNQARSSKLPTVAAAIRGVSPPAPPKPAAAFAAGRFTSAPAA
jgi:hypothetical protein